MWVDPNSRWYNFAQPQQAGRLRCGGEFFSNLRIFGGARRNRTDDLFNAIEALSQLSYGPTFFALTFSKSARDLSLGEVKCRERQELDDAHRRSFSGRLCNPIAALSQPLTDQLSSSS